MSCVSQYFESLMDPEARDLPLVQLYTRPARDGRKELGGPIVSVVKEVLGQVRFQSPNAGENISNAGLVFKPDWIIIECPANRSLHSSVGRMLWNLQDVPSKRVLIVNKYHAQAWSRNAKAKLMRTHKQGPQEIADLARRYGWHVVMTSNGQLEGDLKLAMHSLS